VKHFLFGLLLACGAASAQPRLDYEPPKDFSSSLGRDPAVHVSRNGDAIVNVYPFKPLAGAEFEARFRRTRLRELLVYDSQEDKLAGPVEIQPVPIGGADAAFFARFVEDRAGTHRYRLRLAISARGAVAIVDYNAKGPEGYQANWPAFAAVLDSLKVTSEVANQEPARNRSDSAKGGSGADGLFLASTQRFMPTFGGAPGSGSWTTATRFYLLSKDGRFHRGYGLPSVPGGDLRNFDFARAEREDPHNTGTYTVSGDRVVVRTRGGDSMQGRIAGDELAIDSLKLKKAALKK
jgi:hypothetical protein